MQVRTTALKYVAVIATLGLSGCTLWHSPGYGGYAEHTEVSPNCVRESGGSELGQLDQRLGCLNLRLDTLRRAGADLYLPALVLRAEEQSIRTFREITGRLHDDARIDLFILAAMLDDIEMQMHKKKAPAPLPILIPKVVAEPAVVPESVPVAEVVAVIAVEPEPVVEPEPEPVVEPEPEPVVEPEPEPEPVVEPEPEPALEAESIVFEPVEFVDLSGMLHDVNQSGLYLTGSAAPNPLLLKHLKTLAEALIENDNVHILIVGHTDDSGDNEYNMALGLKRAGNVLNALIQMGVPPVQVCVLSSGEAMPAYMNDAPESRLTNRRIEITETRC